MDKLRQSIYGASHCYLLISGLTLDALLFSELWRGFTLVFSFALEDTWLQGHLSINSSWFLCICPELSKAGVNPGKKWS